MLYSDQEFTIYKQSVTQNAITLTTTTLCVIQTPASSGEMSDEKKEEAMALLAMALLKEYLESKR